MSEKKDVLVNAETIKVLTDIGMERGHIHADDGVKKFMLIPKTHEIQVLPEEDTGEPGYKSGEAKVYDVDSFVSIVQKHVDPERTEIWYQQDEQTFVAIFDGHGSQRPGHGRHTVQFCLRPSADWKAWTPAFEHLIAQTALAELLEDQVHTIAAPADIHDLVRDLEVTKKVHFRAAQDLHNGSVRLEYANDVEGGKGGKRGDIQIPSEMTLVLPLWEGQDPCTLDVRVRYRLDEDRHCVVFKLEIRKWEQILRGEEQKVCDQIQVGTDLQVWRGLEWTNRFW